MVSTETIRRYPPPSRDYLILMLQAVQAQEGFISRESICEISDCMGLPRKGSFNLLETLQRELGIEAGATTRDELFSLEVVACLEACSIAPVMTVREIKVRELRA